MSAESAGAQPVVAKPSVVEPAGALALPTAAQPTVAEPTSANSEPANAKSPGASTEAAIQVAPADIALKIGRVAGAGIGYGCLAAFLYLVSVQVYRWFRDGEWTHFGISEALRAGLVRCCVKPEDGGRLAALVHWIDAPVDWLGLHRVLEIAPASLALFALSITGNSIFIYCCDRIEQRRQRVRAEPAGSQERV